MAGRLSLQLTASLLIFEVRDSYGISELPLIQMIQLYKLGIV